MSEGSEVKRPPQEPKHVRNLHAEEIEAVLQIPGWRMWQYEMHNPFRLTFMDTPEQKVTRDKYLSAQKEAAAKPNALFIAEYIDREYFDRLASTYREKTGHHIKRSSGARGSRPETFLLEPLTEDEVKRIDEDGEAPGPLNSVDKRNEILRPNELESILHKEPQQNR